MPALQLFGTAAVPRDETRQALTYRPDIDGLRALAVLAVVLFHFDFPAFSGGFVGVDVFFVISGYLITSIIVGDLESETFSVSHFYERRIRRIIPAFIVMLAATAIGAIALFPPRELAEFGYSAAAAGAFLSNIYFAYNTDYFSGLNTMMPLLHTWSLGVEEQFYILWPLLLFSCFRIGSRIAVSMIVVTIVIASISYSAWGSTTNESIHFYFLQSRAWELMVGAMLAMEIAPAPGPRWLQESLALLGVAMIALAITQFSPATHFAGLWAIIPCAGALLVLWTGQQRDTATSRILSFKPLVFVGLISYSLYLWHLPIFVFAENYAGRPLSSGEASLLVLISIAIAATSWRYVELPFRKRQDTAIVSQKAVMVAGLGSLVLAAGLGFSLYLGDGLPGRLDPETLRYYLASGDHNTLRHDCLDGTRHKPQEALRCTVPAVTGNNSYDVIVWGDSHGDALFPAIAMIDQKYGLTTRQVTKKGCPPLTVVKQAKHGRGLETCAEYNNEVMEELRRGPRPGLAILVARWSIYTETGEDAERQRPGVGMSHEVFLRELAQTVDALTTLGIRVLLVGQAPEFAQSPSTCVVERVLSQRDVSDCLRPAKPILEERLDESKQILKNLASGRSTATFVGLDSILCDDKVCRTEANDDSLYEDDNHLSLWGARFVGMTLLREPGVKSLFDTEGAQHQAALHQAPL